MKQQTLELESPNGRSETIKKKEKKKTASKNQLLEENQAKVSQRQD